MPLDKFHPVRFNHQRKKDGRAVFHFLSGIRESDPPPWLGKPMHYRCANPAFRYKYRDYNGIHKNLLNFENFVNYNPLSSECDLY